MSLRQPERTRLFTFMVRFLVLSLRLKIRVPDGGCGLKEYRKQLPSIREPVQFSEHFLTQGQRPVPRSGVMIMKADCFSRTIHRKKDIRCLVRRLQAFLNYLIRRHRSSATNTIPSWVSDLTGNRAKDCIFTGYCGRMELQRWLKHSRPERIKPILFEMMKSGVRKLRFSFLYRSCRLPYNLLS